jgi:hypothetical protein
MIGRFNPAGLLAGRPDVQKQAMMAQQQPTRQGLLGQTRSTIGGLLGGLRDRVEQGSPDMTWADRAMIIGAGLRQMGGAGETLMPAQQMIDQRIQGRQAEEQRLAQMEQMQAFRATLPPEQQQMFDMNPEGFMTQMTQAEFRAPPTDPTAVREYQLAVEQGFQGSFMDFDAQRRAASRPQTNINMPIPQREDILSIDGDFVTVRDPSSPTGVRRDLIPGSATDLRQRQEEGERTREEETEADRAARRQQDIARAGGTVIQDLNRALTILDRTEAQGPLSGPTAGPLSGQFRDAPGTPAFEVRQLVESALSNVGLDTLQRMRENSPTGGALGQVPIQQQQRLEQVLGSLDVRQRPEVLRDNLNRVANIYMDIVFGTPQQLAEMRERSEITPDQFETYSRRAELSFDELGRPRPRTDPPPRPDPLGLRGGR